jgi:glycosyltransferase involved in cell wall biosynthesis
LEFATYNLSIELAGLGNTVVIAAPSHHQRILKAEGVTILGIPSWFITDHFYLPKPNGVNLLVGQMKWADVVHIHSPHNTFTQFSALLARLSGKPIVLSVLSHTALLKHPRVIGKLGGFVLEPIAQVLIRWAKIAHTRNPFDQALVSRVNHRVVCVPDGVRAALLSGEKRPGSFKASSKTGDVYPIVLYLGRLHPMKGPQEVIKMLPGLLKHFPKVLAVVVEPARGQGDYARKLLELAQRLGVSAHLLLMTGGIDEGEKISIIDDANVVAVPSLSDSTEAFSIVTSEAWARGKPVVAFPVGALRTRIRNGVNGYLASSVDTEALTTATLNALTLGTIKRSSDVLPWIDTARNFQGIYQRAWEGTQ